MTSVGSADVVVVGAGLAGLAAARVLSRHGVEVLVLEARDRVGGRVHSVRLADGVTADLGAQWIGGGQHRMIALAREFGARLAPTPTAGASCIELGGRVIRGAVGWLSRPHVAIDIVRVAARVTRRVRRIAVDAPWAAVGAEALDRDDLARWLRANAWTDLGYAYWRTVAEAATCVDATALSALDMLQQVRTMGGLGALAGAEREFFVDGAQAIPQAIADELGDRVVLRQPVRRIACRGDHVLVSSEQQEFVARQVIVAVPLALAAGIDYAPALPPARQALIASTVRGRVLKSVLAFDNAWWRPRRAGAVLSQSGPVTALIDSSPSRGGPGVLVALAAGQHASALASLGAEQRRACVLAQVDRWLGPGAPPPLAYAECDWTGEPWSGGGYASCVAPLGWTRIGASHAADCASASAVHWAGADIARQWRGYMEGAVACGESAADAVLQQRTAT